MMYKEEIELFFSDMNKPPKLFIDNKDYSDKIISIDYKYKTVGDDDECHYYEIEIIDSVEGSIIKKVKMKMERI